MPFDSRESRHRLKPPPNYQARSVQLRLLGLVGLLFLVILAMQHAAQPQNWQWLWGQRLERQTNSIALDTSLTTVQQAGRIPPGIDATRLSSITDDTHFRKDESLAWFHVLRFLKGTTDTDLQSMSQGPASHLQLSQQTDAYRGQLVSLSGNIRRAHRLNAPENDIGIHEYWQCWLFLDNGPQKPIVAYALDMPHDFHGGMELDQRASLTGVVFKRWAFRSAEELTVAPVVLAKTIRLWSPTTGARTAPRTNSNGLLLAVVAATAVVAVLTAFVLFRRSDRKPRVASAGEPPVELPTDGQPSGEPSISRAGDPQS